MASINAVVSRIVKGGYKKNSTIYSAICINLLIKAYSGNQSFFVNTSLMS